MTSANLSGTRNGKWITRSEYEAEMRAAVKAGNNAAEIMIAREKLVWSALEALSLSMFDVAARALLTVSGPDFGKVFDTVWGCLARESDRNALRSAMVRARAH